MRRRLKRRVAAIGKNIRKESIGFKRAIVEKFATLITTGFGIVAALAWNSAIQEFFKNNEWLENKGPWVYAILVTIFAVIITLWIGSLSAKLNENAKEVEDKK